MAWKSFYLSTAVVSVAALPFLGGASGLGNLPDGPCLVAANHSSFLDGPFLAAVYARARLRPLHMIAYEEPFHNWLLGYILRSGQCIPFRRGDRRSQGEMLRTALGWMAAGDAVGIFPEGHINQKPRLNRPRPGAALLALESGLPVVPAAIIGSDKAMPLGAALPRPGRRVRVVFGRPVGLQPKETRYASLPRDERQNLVRNLGFRIMNAIAMLAGREYRDA